MGSLTCKELIKPRDCDGYKDKPTMKDKEILSKFWYEDCIEMKNSEPINMEQAVLDVEDMINSGKLSVWKNDNNEIVCMLYYGITDNYVSLNHAYTYPNARGRGYAANLVYAVTKELLDKGLTPLLYTDYNYPASNKAYKNVGYIDTGVLINFSCSKSKDNIKVR